MVELSVKASVLAQLKANNKAFMKLEKESIPSMDWASTRQQMEISEYISTGAFGCNSEAVAKLCSILIGQKILFNINPKLPKFKDGCVIVCTGNSTSHYYPINKPIIVWDWDEEQAIQPNGDIGNHFPRRSYDQTRLATNEEIELLTAEQLKAYIDHNYYYLFGDNKE